MAIPEYIDPEFEESGDDIEEEAFQYIAAEHPNWEPNPANLETLIIQYMAMRAGVLADQMGTVFATIFRYFGKSVLNVPAQEALQATASTTWTAKDNAGYTIPEGSVIGLVDENGDLQPFATIQEYTIPAASLSLAGVTVRSLDPGTLYNNLGGTVQPLTALDWLADVSVQGLSSGGEDAEDDDEYQARLARRIALMAPRPIKAVDFALMAMDEPGVYRATASDNTQIQTRSAIHTIAHDGTGGTFTITVDGQTTTAQNWNDNLAAILADVEALSTVAPGDLVLTGANPGTITFTWGGAKANVDIAFSANFTSLTGETFNTVTETQEGGSAPRYDVERAVAVALIDENGVEPAPAVLTAVETALEAMREQNFIVSIVSPTSTTINVTATVKAIDGWTTSDVDSAVTQAVADYLSPANWGVPEGEQPGWDNITAVRYLELATLINNVQGVDYIQSLTFGAPSLGTTDVTLSGIFPLPAAGTINITVT